MTDREWMQSAAERLKGAGIDGAESDARLLYEYVTGRGRLAYTLEPQRELPADQKERLEELLEKRCRRIPLQQLTGQAWFMEDCFFVNEHVLIPRADTEILAESAIAALKTLLKNGTPRPRVLDLCTGSGCILLSLLRAVPQAEGTGSDLSPEALQVAKINRDRLGLNAVFSQSDLFDKIEGKYDMILSNPPYIASGVIASLEPEVRDHEPLLALDGGGDGLDLYRRIVREAPGHLKPGGRLMLEIGYDQGEALKEMLARAGFSEIRIEKDLGGCDRMAAGRYL